MSEIRPSTTSPPHCATFGAQRAPGLVMGGQAFSGAAGAPPNSPPANVYAPSSKYSHKAQPAQPSLALDNAKRVLKSGMKILGPQLLPREEILIRISTCCTSLPTACGCTTTSIPYDHQPGTSRTDHAAALAYLDSLPDVSQAHF